MKEQCNTIKKVCVCMYFYMSIKLSIICVLIHINACIVGCVHMNCILLNVIRPNTEAALLWDRVGTKHSRQPGVVGIRGVGVTVSCCATSHLTSRFTPTCLFSLQLVPCFPQPGRQRQCSL